MTFDRRRIALAAKVLALDTEEELVKLERVANTLDVSEDTAFNSLPIGTLEENLDVEVLIAANPPKRYDQAKWDELMAEIEWGPEETTEALLAALD